MAGARPPAARHSHWLWWQWYGRRPPMGWWHLQASASRRPHCKTVNSQGMTQGFRDRAGQPEARLWQHTLLCWPTDASCRGKLCCTVRRPGTAAPASPQCALANDLQGRPAAACQHRLMIQQMEQRKTEMTAPSDAVQRQLTFSLLQQSQLHKLDGRASTHQCPGAGQACTCATTLLLYQTVALLQV